MSYFKLYNHFFENESYVTEMTDVTKVLWMLIHAKVNKVESENKAKGTQEGYITNQFWLTAALGLSKRQTLTKHMTKLRSFNIFDYDRGYRKSPQDRKPTVIRNIREEGFFTQIDHYTFEYMLFELMRKKKIEHRHIFVYALCKYIEQFKDGSMSFKDFGRCLKLTSEEIQYKRISKHLEELKSLGLIDFKRGRGMIEEVCVKTKKANSIKIHEWSITLQTAAGELYDIEMKSDTNKEVGSAPEDMPAAKSMDDVIKNVMDRYNKLKADSQDKAIITVAQRTTLARINGLKISEIDELSHSFFVEERGQIWKTKGHVVLNVFASYLFRKQYEKPMSGKRELKQAHM